MNGASLRDPGRAYHELTMRIMDLQAEIRSSNGGRYDTPDHRVIDDCLNIIFDYFKGDEIIAPEDNVLDYMRLVLDGAERDGNDELSTRMERAIQAYRADPNESYCLATGDWDGLIRNEGASVAQMRAEDAAPARQILQTPIEALAANMTRVGETARELIQSTAVARTLDRMDMDTRQVGPPQAVSGPEPPGILFPPRVREMAAENLRRSYPLWYGATPEARAWFAEYDHGLSKAWEEVADGARAWIEGASTEGSEANRERDGA